MPDETPATDAPVKDGYKTTEFWLHAIVTICGLIAAALPQTSTAVKIAGLVSSVVSTGLYGFQRASVKNAAQILVLCLLPFFVMGCSGLAAKTAKDIDTASSMILPEYLNYVANDPKLSADQKTDRQNQVRALQDVIRNAQK